MSQLLICDWPLLFEDFSYVGILAGLCTMKFDLSGEANAGIIFADRIKKLPKEYIYMPCIKMCC
jgi:hypothetical protein